MSDEFNYCKCYLKLLNKVRIIKRHFMADYMMIFIDNKYNSNPNTEGVDENISNKEFFNNDLRYYKVLTQ